MADIELTIDSVGVRGDGVAHDKGRAVFVPLTAPGDRIRARLTSEKGEARAELVELIAPGQRQAPPCRHFGDCGGCTLQHLFDMAYAEAKVAWLEGALAQHGFKDVAIAPLHRLPPKTRRRARFTLENGKGGASVGFHARKSHRVVDMRECHVLHPDVFDVVAKLRAVAGKIFSGKGEGTATVTLADGGLDVLLDLSKAPDLRGLETLAAFAESADLARLSWRADDMEAPVAQRRPARVVFAGVAVDLPAENFLQASAQADAALAAAVVDGVGPAKKIADLYAGLGTFTFALAQQAAVHAVEGEASASRACGNAAARAKLTRVTTECRDLVRRPLAGDELKGYDAVVFDPPRAGAAEQSRALAASKVPVVVAVSCSPASFARDARILADGGYALTRVRPFDSFIWSPHLEIVARFERR